MDFSAVKVNLKKNLYRGKVKLAIKSRIPRNAQTDKFQKKHKCHRVFYVRYVIDSLIGIKGPKFVAFEIKKRASDFLKFTLHFSLKESEMVCVFQDKIKFLGFDISMPKRLDRNVIETRRILSFKKIRNRIIQRKNGIETRYKKSLLSTYESILKKKLKQLGKGSRLEKENHIKQLAIKGAIEFHELASLSNKK